MEVSAIAHEMNQCFAYKLGEHQYLIKLRTKKDDFDSVEIGYCDKYLREMGNKILPSKTFYQPMRKVASSFEHDYYEVILSDELLLEGVNESLDQLLPNIPDQNYRKALEDVRRMEGKKFAMLAIRYFFALRSKEETVYFGNYKIFDEVPYTTIDMFNLVIYQADSLYFKTPKWAKGAIIYQIFPERFAAKDDKVSSDWFLVPMQSKIRTNGSLIGIKEKIPYLKELGIDAIYLNPIFLANSNHRYDTIDYLQVDPSLGGDEALLDLVDELHKNNIKIILDLVFNHSSINFFAFQDVLKNQEKSKYKDWFFISKYPVEPRWPSDYLSYSYSPFMPKLNTDNPECREYLFKVVRRYLEQFHVDGYRLDVADEITHSFWKEFRKLCKSINPDCLIMGEIWYDSIPYLQGDEFDSVMNYTYFDAIRGLLSHKYSVETFITLISKERGNSSLNYFHHSNLLIGSHDTDRIYQFLGKSYLKTKQALTLLFTLPGAPLLYYGDEKMMEGEKDPDCRRGMIFDPDYHQEALKLSKKLIQIKHLLSFKEGEISFSKIPGGLSYSRNDGKASYRVIYNLSDHPLQILAKGEDLISGEAFDGLLAIDEVVILKE